MRIEIQRDDNDVVSGTWIADRLEHERNDRFLLCDMIGAELSEHPRGWDVQIFRANGTAITDDMPSDGTFVASVNAR